MLVGGGGPGQEDCDQVDQTNESQSNAAGVQVLQDVDFVNNQIDIEVFNSSQNKTTEQKYAELKLKYNDLLSKHFALAAQKTEDNRFKRPTQKK